jgi:hypothetical protein
MGYMYKDSSEASEEDRKEKNNDKRIDIGYNSNMEGGRRGTVFGREKNRVRDKGRKKYFPCHE